jgi:hypothetical protein
MSARRHRFSGCGHFGFGAYCHRCKQAEELKAKANSLQAKLGVSFHSDGAVRLLAEAERLKARA